MPERLAGLYTLLIEQARSLPGVQAAAFGRQRLIANAAWSSGIVVAGFTPGKGTVAGKVFRTRSSEFRVSGDGDDFCYRVWSVRRPPG